jgi:hypothetical protein
MVSLTMLKFFAYATRELLDDIHFKSSKELACGINNLLPCSACLYHHKKSLDMFHYDKNDINKYVNDHYGCIKGGEFLD